MNKFYKFCNRVTSDPMFGAVMVFSISFIFSGYFIQVSSVDDGGVKCNKINDLDERTLCTKMNGVSIILAFALPIMAGMSTYILARKKKFQGRYDLSRGRRLLHT